MKPELTSYMLWLRRRSLGVACKGASIAVAFAAIASLTHAAQVSVSWASAVNGQWKDNTKWNNSTVPNNAGGTTYLVHLAATGSNYIISQSGALGAFVGTIDELQQSSANATLLLNGGNLEFLNPSTVTAGLLKIAGGTLTASSSLNVTGDFEWGQSGTLTGAGSITLDPSAGRTASASGATVRTLSTTIHNKGLLTWIGGGTEAWSWSSGTFDNQAGATFQRTSADTFISGTGTFTNAGTFENDTGCVTTFPSLSSMFFNNTGTVSVLGGNLYLGRASGSGDTGDYSVSSSGTLSFQNGSGTRTFASSSDISGAGTVQFLEPGTRVSDGTVNVTGTLEAGDGSGDSGTNTLNGSTTVANLFVSGEVTLNLNAASDSMITHLTQDHDPANNPPSGPPTLGGSGIVQVSNTLGWQGGTMTGSGRTVSSGVMTIDLHDVNITGGRTVENGGTLNWSKGAIRLNNGTLKNLSSGTVSVPSSGVTNLNVKRDSGTASFTNEGTLNKLGSSTTTVESNVTFSNTGTVDVQAGTLQLSGTVSQVSSNTLTAGTWKVAASSTLGFPAASNLATNSAIVTLTGASSSFAALENNLATNSGTLNILGGRAFTTPSSLANSSGGTLKASAGSSCAVAGTFTNSGTLAFGIGGSSSYGSLSSSSMTTLGGTLTVTLEGGYQPNWGDHFVILTYPSVSSNFATVTTLPTLTNRGGALRWYKNKTGSMYELVVHLNADINRDNMVNSADTAQVLGAWGTNDPEADMNQDGTVDSTDLAIVNGSWGQTPP